jgi:IS30 family transposase
MSRRYSQLNLNDRRRLFHFVERKVPIKEMARTWSSSIDDLP